MSLRVCRLSAFLWLAGCLMPLGAQIPGIDFFKRIRSGILQPGGTIVYEFGIFNNRGGILDGFVLTDILPAGLTATAISPTDICSLGPPVTCTFDVSLGRNVILTVSVAPNIGDSVTNTATLSFQGQTATATATDAVFRPPDWTIAKTHSGNFTAGQRGTYTIVVTNIGAPGSDDVTLTDTLPPGLTAIDALGLGWRSCTPGATTTCTGSFRFRANEALPPITLTVNVAPNAPASVTNTATVSSPKEVNTANNTATDVTNINPLPDLSIAKSHTGNFIAGQSGTYSIMVSNAAGGGPTFGQVTVSDPLPTGLTATAASGTGWTCGVGPPVSCTRSDALAAGAS